MARAPRVPLTCPEPRSLEDRRSVERGGLASHDMGERQVTDPQAMIRSEFPS
jgi:hypothetical protein